MINKYILRSVILTMLTLSWMLLIYLFSGADDNTSRTQSGSICTFLCEVFVDGFEEMLPEQQQALEKRLSFPVRKGAHLTEYAVLGALLTLTAGSYAAAIEALAGNGTDRRVNVFLSGRLFKILPLIIGVLYAVSDEIHQRSVPGRAGQLRDVLIDTAGVLTGILLINALRRRRQRRNKNRVETAL